MTKNIKNSLFCHQKGYGKDITEGKQKQLEPISAKILVSSENAKPNEKSISIKIDKSANQYIVEFK
jgi:hypothetical protein